MHLFLNTTNFKNIQLLFNLFGNNYQSLHTYIAAILIHIYQYRAASSNTCEPKERATAGINNCFMLVLFRCRPVLINLN